MARLASNAFRPPMQQLTKADVLSQLTNILCWFEGDNTMTVDGSNRISQWNDASAAGAHATQPTAGQQPLLVASGINGLPVARFKNSRNDNMAFTTTFPGGGNAHTLFVVFQENAAHPATFTSIITLGQGAASGNTSLIGQENTGALWFGGAGAGVPTLTTLGSSEIVMAAKQTTSTLSGVSVDFLWKNGIQYRTIKQISNYNISVATAGNLGLFTGGGASGNHDVALAIAFQVRITNYQMAILNAYAGMKYGIGTWGRSASAVRSASATRLDVS